MIGKRKIEGGLFVNQERKDTTCPRTPNPLHLECLTKFINESPYIDLLSMKLVALGSGFAEVELELQKKQYNPLGGVHGGVYASLIDSATFWAAYCDLDEGYVFTSLDVHVTYVAPAKTGKLLARGKLIKMGKTLGLAKCEVVEESGKIIAYG